MRREPVNSASQCHQRYFELDLAKALAIVFMFFVHARMLWGDYNTSSVVGFVIDFAGTPICAPVFMICMGAGWFFSRHNTAKDFLWRGLKLLFLGYLLNLIRLSIPLSLIGNLPGGFSELTPVNSFFPVDILQFAGMAFLFMALAKKFNLSDTALFGVTILFATLGGLLNGRLLNGIEPLPAMQGLLVYAGFTTSFPLLSWIVYPVAGFIFARKLASSDNKNRFYATLGALSLVIGFGIFATGKLYGMNFHSYFGEDTYYGQTLFSSFGILSIAFLWMALVYFISRLCTNNIVKRIINRWSVNILMMYFIQWVIFDWSAIILHRFGVQIPANNATTILIGIVVLILADFSGYYYHHLKEKIILICRK